MTRYEQTMYERDLPEIRKALTNISKSLQDIVTIISDPGDEMEHIYKGKKNQYDALRKLDEIWGKNDSHEPIEMD